jgi:hypothetical protein
VGLKKAFGLPSVYPGAPRVQIFSLRDPEAEKDGDLRIIDESGEDYLYPRDWFVLITVPDAVEASLLRTA